MLTLSHLLPKIATSRKRLSTEVLSSEFIETLHFKTPFFVFSRNKILSNYLEYKELFPKSTILYAMKANSEPEILRLLAHAGSSFEVASIYELNLLKKIDVPPGKIVYGSSIKPFEHIRDFFKYGVDRFAFDSLSELEKIAIAAPGSRVFVRMIANDSGSVFKFSGKFGVTKEAIVPLLLRAKELGLKPYGISFHVGSQASDPLAWTYCIESLIPVMKELQNYGIIIDVLNIGGGYPCRYASGENLPSLPEIARNISLAYNELPYSPKLLLEPGRGIIADTAVLVVNVIGKVERSENTWLFLDAGVYNGLFETMAYQGSTRYSVTSLRPVKSSGEAIFALAGPTGDSEDVITREALLPSDMAIGDKLIFYKVGAYSLVVSNPFNGFPKPKVIYI